MLSVSYHALRTEQATALVNNRRLCSERASSWLSVVAHVHICGDRLLYFYFVGIPKRYCRGHIREHGQDAAMYRTFHGSLDRGDT